MKWLFGIIVACFLAATAVASDDLVFSPYSFELGSHNYDAETGSITFPGSITISGDLVFRFDLAGEGQSVGDLLWALFIPDPADKACLPQVVQGYFAAPIDTIWLNYDGDILDAAFGPTRAVAIRHGTRTEVGRRATIRITNFWTSVECDHRGYGATVVSIADEPTVVATETQHGGGC